MKIEVGKYYRNREGDKRGPMELIKDRFTGSFYMFTTPIGGTYGKNGNVWESGECDKRDLIEEWESSPNPKQRHGDKKPPLAQVPLAGMVAQSLAHMDGDLKYGFRNWRDDPVEAMTYVHAALRHLMLWAEGEEDARDTNVPNLGAVMACCAILLDAQANGSMIDNRSKSEAACDMLHYHERSVTFLRDRLDNLVNNE